jgi:hypothetical protein
MGVVISPDDQRRVVISPDNHAPSVSLTSHMSSIHARGVGITDAA